MRFFSFFSRKKKKIKIGLALGSGGAKGFAELGVIKALEEEGITFDYIAGTSIGSIIGAFLSNGYSSTDINELLKRINAKEISNFLSLGMNTSGLKKVIEKNLGDIKFSDLQKPFKAVATEYESGEQAVFGEGNVAECLCASACIPPYFKPVEINGKKYVDGAFSDSIPADVVKDMGADYIIGVDISTPKGEPSLIEKILPVYKGKTEEPRAKGYEYSDVVIHPNLSGYNGISFGSADYMYEIGYETAKKQVTKIKSDIEKAQKKK